MRHASHEKQKKIGVKRSDHHGWSLSPVVLSGWRHCERPNKGRESTKTSKVDDGERI